jgi:hypothetical protein
VSESQSDSQSGDGQSSGSTSGSSRYGSGSSSSGPSGSSSGGSSGSRQSDGRQPDGRRTGKQAGDPVADLQRWLMKAGARSMANQVADNVRRTLGQQKRDSGDVWDTATTEPPPDEPPECQWCPVCQAARKLRVSGPGLGARIADAGGVLATVVQEAFTAVEQAMKTPPAERTVVTPPATTSGNGAGAKATAAHEHPTIRESPAARENPATPS